MKARHFLKYDASQIIYALILSNDMPPFNIHIFAFTAHPHMLFTFIDSLG